MTRAALQRRRAPRAAGLTFIEVVVATALLALLASVVTGSISFMQTAAARDRHRLNAMEVANRIIVQYLDNPNKLPPETLPIQQGDSLYRFSLTEEVLVQDEGAAQKLAKRRAVPRAQLSAEEQLPQMLNRLTVQVFLDDPGSPINTARPMAELARIYNPIRGDEDAVLGRLLGLVDQVQRETAERARNTAPGSGTATGGADTRRRGARP